MTFMDGSMADIKQFIEKAHRSQHNVQKMTKQERVMLKALLKKAMESYKDEVVHYKERQNQSMATWRSLQKYGCG